MDEILEFASLITYAKMLLQDNPTADQVLAVYTSAGNTYGLANHGVMAGNKREEAKFIHDLRDWEDTQICAMVCMWQGCCLDVPSMHFREKLLALDPYNSEAKILLQGADNHLIKKLETLMPNSITAIPKE